eukprot:Rhum_TRINITY_DN14969_c8_g1::Rhum_TRINITY_DN14969_c8_g1_i1::g.130631::m.130631
MSLVHEKQYPSPRSQGCLGRVAVGRHQPPLVCTLDEEVSRRHNSPPRSQHSFGPARELRCTGVPRCTQGEEACHRSDPSRRPQCLFRIFTGLTPITRPERSPWSAGAYSIAGIPCPYVNPGHRCGEKAHLPQKLRPATSGTVLCHSVRRPVRFTEWKGRHSEQGLAGRGYGWRPWVRCPPGLNRLIFVTGTGTVRESGRFTTGRLREVFSADPRPSFACGVDTALAGARVAPASLESRPGTGTARPHLERITWLHFRAPWNFVRPHVRFTRRVEPVIRFTGGSIHPASYEGSRAEAEGYRLHIDPPSSSETTPSSSSRARPPTDTPNPSTHSCGSS